MGESLHQRLARALPDKRIFCRDPQCGDSTWDHDCDEGYRPNHELAARLATEVQEWLRERGGEIDRNQLVYGKALLHALADSLDSSTGQDG
jgi:hypothetical protein